MLVIGCVCEVSVVVNLQEIVQRGAERKKSKSCNIWGHEQGVQFWSLQEFTKSSKSIERRLKQDECVQLYQSLSGEEMEEKKNSRAL